MSHFSGKSSEECHAIPDLRGSILISELVSVSGDRKGGLRAWGLDLDMWDRLTLTSDLQIFSLVQATEIEHQARISTYPRNKIRSEQRCSSSSK